MTTMRTRTWITPGFAFGVVVLLLGLVLTLETFGLFEVGRFIRYWPVVLIVVGVAQLVQAASTGSRPAGLALIFLGSAFLLVTLDVLRFTQALALVVLGTGASLVWRVVRNPGGLRGAVADPSREIDAVALLGGVQRTLSAQDFRGGNATAILGGCEVDLGRASMEAGEAVINACAIWGGIEIRVPADWVVEMQGVAVLGGFTDSSRRPDHEGKKLIVTGFALMGGVEVRN
jgi:predicted membrane protein